MFYDDDDAMIATARQWWWWWWWWWSGYDIWYTDTLQLFYRNSVCSRRWYSPV